VASNGTLRCRFCETSVDLVAADLGMSPLSNSYVTRESLGTMEPFYPLQALVCERCFLVQLPQFESPCEVFSEYGYFSSYSSSWLAHASRYAATMTARLGLDQASLVVEIASNDGYLLQYFASRQIPTLGVEPAANVAEAARAKGIRTVVEFFGQETARRLADEGQADLLIANNVIAHVPDLNDFVAGMRLLLAPGGTITVEFPHLLRLIDGNQYDTIYHEHLSYLSFFTVRDVFAAHGLVAFDVEEIPTHGGSLRVHAAHGGDGREPTARAQALERQEVAEGLRDPKRYEAFMDGVRAEKRATLSCLISLKEAGMKIAAYGAPAKGNTFLNYCGIGTDFVDFTVDRNPYKQGRFLPGSHIPILAPEAIFDQHPDVIVVLPWNLRDEIVGELAAVREWGARFVARPGPVVIE